MLGAIIGDIVGSRFEFNNTKDYNFELFGKGCNFTDDTICTIAVAYAILEREINEEKPTERDYRNSLQYWCKKYPNPMGAYGASFSNWVHSSNPQPYDSYGNGAAMRVSPTAWAFKESSDAIRQAIMSAKVSHSHTEGLIGAAAVSNAIFSLRKGEKKGMLNIIANVYYGIKWEDRIPPRGKWAETCQECVPLAFKIVLDSDSFEDAIRRAVSYGGDSDTMGAIVGSIAEPLFGIPQEIKEKAMSYLPLDMKNVVTKFIDRYGE